eukprot:1062747-Rhodomonas_salina.1
MFSRTPQEASGMSESRHESLWHASFKSGGVLRSMTSSGSTNSVDSLGAASIAEPEPDSEVSLGCRASMLGVPLVLSWDNSSGFVA